MSTALFIAAAIACTSPSDNVEVRMNGRVSHITIIYQMTGECGAMIEIMPEADSPILVEKPKRKRLPCKAGRHRNAKGQCGRWR